MMSVRYRTGLRRVAGSVVPGEVINLLLHSRCTPQFIKWCTPVFGVHHGVTQLLSICFSEYYLMYLLGQMQDRLMYTGLPMYPMM